MKRALARREPLVQAASAAQPTTAFRLFHREADGDAGVAIDVYERFAVLHVFDARGEQAERALGQAIGELGHAGVYLKRHPRQKNELVDAQGSGLAPAEPLWGQAAPDPLVVHEHGLPFGVRLGDGLRTGLFLDQRGNRQLVRQRAGGKRVLNLFSYTGGFAVAALAGGASHVLCVDSSRAALERARDNVGRLGEDELGRRRALCDDAIDVLGRLSRRGERFDLVIVDPPSYSRTRSRRFRVRQDYTDLCRACLRVLSPGGQLLACLNHHGTSQRELVAFVTRAAQQEGRALEACKVTPGGLDYPVPGGHEPELKSNLTRLS